MKIHLFWINILLIILGCELIPEAVEPPSDEIVVRKNIIHQDTLTYDLDSLMNNLKKVIESPLLMNVSDTNRVNIVSINKEQILFFGKTEGSTVIKFQINEKKSKSTLYFDLEVISCPWQLDCLGKCNGNAVIDSCNVCNGDDDCDCPGFPDGTTKDCNGECGGDSVFDECNVCDNEPINDCVQDCSGIWGGNSSVDNCGICNENQIDDCQEKKSVLVEVVTNAGCIPCLPVNHVLDEILDEQKDNMTMIRYHWNSPLPIDPMYDYNPADVELRRVMYDVIFCPVVIINGVHILNGQNHVENNANNVVLSEIAQESVLFLGHTSSLIGDSIYVDMEIRPFETINESVKSWAIVVEDSIEYAAYNGELIHNQVMRDLQSGEEWQLLQKDGIYTSQISLLKPEGYSSENPFFHVITMVQSVETNRVFQSNRLHAPLEIDTVQ